MTQQEQYDRIWEVYQKYLGGDLVPREKIYHSGLIVGRFQVLHLGHADMINKALAICDRVFIMIGSSQESRTAKNPLTFEERKEMISAVFEYEVKSERIVILPLPDAGLGNNEKWGDYVFASIPGGYPKPDITISGRESRRSTWFDNQNIAELFIEKTVNISASEMRKFLKNDDETAWKAYSPTAIHSMYNKLKTIVLKTQDVTNTDSI